MNGFDCVRLAEVCPLPQKVNYNVLQESLGEKKKQKLKSTRRINKNKKKYVSLCSVFEDLVLPDLQQMRITLVYSTVSVKSVAGFGVILC